MVLVTLVTYNLLYDVIIIFEKFLKSLETFYSFIMTICTDPWPINQSIYGTSKWRQFLYSFTIGPPLFLSSTSLWYPHIVLRSLSTWSFQEIRGLSMGILPLVVLFMTWRTRLIFWWAQDMSEPTYSSASWHFNDIWIFISASCNVLYCIVLKGWSLLF